MDETDRALLDHLARDARISTAELARRVGLSAPSVADRMRRLESNGIIGGYAASVSAPALGFPIAAWLRVRPVPGKLHTVAALLQGRPEISVCDRVTGDDCFVARAHVRSVGHLEELIDALIPHAMTNTSIIQSSPVPERVAPVLIGSE